MADRHIDNSLLRLLVNNSHHEDMGLKNMERGLKFGLKIGKRMRKMSISVDIQL